MHDHGPTRSHIHTKGDTIHWARSYDWLLSAITFGLEGRFRRRVVEAAGIGEGDRVLDIGCGTGTLAIEAARRVGASGRVEGVDPAPEMIERAKTKAEAAGVDAGFRLAAIEDLPYPDDHFDVVLNTLVYHHLPGPVQQKGLEEMRRVLAPGGRLFIVDFKIGDTFLHRVASSFMSHHHDDEEERGELDAAFTIAQRLGFEAVELERFRPRVFLALRATWPGDA